MFHKTRFSGGHQILVSKQQHNTRQKTNITFHEATYSLSNQLLSLFFPPYSDIPQIFGYICILDIIIIFFNYLTSNLMYIYGLTIKATFVSRESTFLH